MARSLLSLLLLLALLLCASSAFAEVYKYIDSAGQTHYVTDPTKVPRAYQDQVIKDIALPKLGRYQSYGKKLQPGESTPAPARPSLPIAPSGKVEVLVTSWCPYCKKLEAFLRERKIAYVRYDIEHDSRGMKLHDQLGGGGVPITRIGTNIVRGYNPDGILQALNQTLARKGVEESCLPWSKRNRDG